MKGEKETTGKEKGVGDNTDDGSGSWRGMTAGEKRSLLYWVKQHRFDGGKNVEPFHLEGIG